MYPYGNVKILETNSMSSLDVHELTMDFVRSLELTTDPVTHFSGDVIGPTRILIAQSRIAYEVVKILESMDTYIPGHVAYKVVEDLWPIIMSPHVPVNQNLQ